MPGGHVLQTFPLCGHCPWSLPTRCFCWRCWFFCYGFSDEGTWLKILSTLSYWLVVFILTEKPMLLCLGMLIESSESFEATGWWYFSHIHLLQWSSTSHLDVINTILARAKISHLNFCKLYSNMWCGRWWGLLLCEKVCAPSFPGGISVSSSLPPPGGPPS